MFSQHQRVTIPATPGAVLLLLIVIPSQPESCVSGHMLKSPVTLLISISRIGIFRSNPAYAITFAFALSPLRPPLSLKRKSQKVSVELCVTLFPAKSTSLPFHSHSHRHRLRLRLCSFASASSSFLKSQEPKASVELCVTLFLAKSTSLPSH